MTTVYSSIVVQEISKNFPTRVYGLSNEPDPAQEYKTSPGLINSR